MLKKLGKFILLLSLLLQSCQNTIDDKEKGNLYSVSNETIFKKYEMYFPIGTAISVNDLSKENSLVNQYNLFVAENIMKPSLLRTKSKKWFWDDADRFIEFTKRRNSKARGHVLVWHQMTPWWMTNGTKSSVKKNLENHISTLVKRYKEDIYCWDVVNEAVSDFYGYRKDSPWYKSYGGPEYIVDAFKAAKKADPNCLLFYNDYNVTNLNKRKMIIKMIKELDLVNNGLDGIGIQAHWTLNYPSLKSIEKTIDEFYEMGLLVEITELDISIYSGIFKNQKEKEYDKVIEEKLAKRYKEIFDLFRRKSDRINAVTMWGITDDTSWLNYYRAGEFFDEKRNNYPLLFDSHGNPKKHIWKL